MGAHVGDTGSDGDEIRWQTAQMSAAVGRALRRLPLLGTDSSGPLGSGLLASGGLAVTIRALQASVVDAS
jgi:hypothetical protein